MGISSRPRLTAVLILALASTLWAAWPLPVEAAGKRPNILLIVVDDK